MTASERMAGLVEMLRLAAGDAATARIMHMQGGQPSPLTMTIAAQANDALLAAIAKLEAARDEATRRLAVVEEAVRVARKSIGVLVDHFEAMGGEEDSSQLAYDLPATRGEMP